MKNKLSKSELKLFQEFTALIILFVISEHWGRKKGEYFSLITVATSGKLLLAPHIYYPSHPPDRVWPFRVPALLLCVVWVALYAACQLAVELISGLPLWLADPIRLGKPGWLDWHTPSKPASNCLWPYTGVWLLRTSQSRPALAFLNNPNIDHRGSFLTRVLDAFLRSLRLLVCPLGELLLLQRNDM